MQRQVEFSQYKWQQATTAKKRINLLANASSVATSNTEKCNRFQNVRESSAWFIFLLRSLMPSSKQRVYPYSLQEKKKRTSASPSPQIELYRLLDKGLQMSKLCKEVCISSKFRAPWLANLWKGLLRGHGKTHRTVKFTRRASMRPEAAL